MEQLLRDIQTIVRQAGGRLLAAENPVVRPKSGIGNFVTDQDLETQRYLRRELTALVPGVSFMGEEDDTHAPPAGGQCFIVDPIDGTANFIRGANYSAISVALAENGAPVMGVVFNPWSGEMFSAERGRGAWCGDKRIRVSPRPLSEGIVVMGLSSYKRDFNERQFRIFRTFFDRCADMRILGSAALDICGVACGRWEAFAELCLSPWDYAAAMCILSEAGGRLTDADGLPVGFSGETSVLAASAACYPDALACCV